MERLDAIVRGRVQGVSFRYHCRHEAEGLGLTGWVANQRDGTVRVVAEGPRPVLETLLGWLHRGSPAARVEGVEARWGEATGEFAAFGLHW